MELKELMGLYQQSGFNVYELNGQIFCNKSLINYSFPLLEEAELNREIIEKLNWRFPISVLKIKTHFTNTHEYILKTSDYSLGMFKQKVAKSIRRSLESFEFRRPSLEELIDQGLIINRQALKFQSNRTDSSLTNSEKWAMQATAFYKSDDVIIYAAFRDGKMAGYIITCAYKEKYFNHLKHFDRSFSHYSPMQGLLFKVINQILTEKGEIEISDGMESYKHLPGLQRFKSNMLFQRVPCARVYLIHPLVLKIIKILISCNVLIPKGIIKSRPYFRTLVHLYSNRIQRRLSF
jgi:hypothetical protein